MIARTWHGRVPAEKADSYYSYLRRTGLADYAATPGNLGVTVLRRTEGTVTHFLLLTLWESIDAVKHSPGQNMSWRITTLRMMNICWTASHS